MRFAILLAQTRVVIGCLCAGALAASACADGRRLPTGPSATTAVSGVAAAASAASSPRSGELHVEKGCPPPGFTGQANDFCTITSSNIKAIEVGSRVVYASAAGPTSLDSDVRLVVGPGNTAFGHCYVEFATLRGLCTFSGGTGKFTHFEARIDVSYRGDTADPYDWAWEGTYSFRPHD